MDGILFTCYVTPECNTLHLLWPAVGIFFNLCICVKGEEPEETSSPSGQQCAKLLESLNM